MVVATAISVGLAAYGAGASFFASVAAGWGTLGAFGSFLAQSALGFALNALAPKPKSRGANRGYQINTRGSALDHQIIYGEARVGGVIIFEESVRGAVDGENQFLLRVYAHAGHEVEGYQEVYIDGKKVTEWRRVDNDAVVSGPSAVANGVSLIPYTVCDVRSDGTVIPESEDPESCSNRYAFYLKESTRSNDMVLRFYDGTQTTADAVHVADSDGNWNTDCVLNNIAYMTSTMGFSQDTYPNGVPEITCTIRGKKCFDPRSGTTVYSQNPAICIRDYLTNEYGLNEDSANIDDTLVATAANVCDQDVEVSISRYTCKGAFTTSVEPANILSDLLTSMGGLLWYSQGKWRMKPAYWTPPTLTLNEDDLRSNIALKTRHSRRDNFNVVKGTFRGSSTNWQVTDYPEVPSGTNPFLAVDNGQESVIDLDLPFTDNPFICRRIARIFLERNRQQLTISGSFGLRAFGLQIGDNVNLTLERFGWVEKTFEVNSWTFGMSDDNDLQVQMTLRETSENAFDEVDDGAVFELDNTKLPSPFLTETPTNLTAVDGGFINTDGTFVNSVILSWSVVRDRLVKSYIVEWKKSTATEYNSVEVDTKNFEIPSVEDGVQYDIRVRSVNAVGVFSDFVSSTFTPESDTTAPGLPTNISAVGYFQSAVISWTDASPANDLSKYNIYRSFSDIFGSAQLVGSTTGRSYNDSGLADNTTYYYWVTAEDYSGNESSESNSDSATTNFISAAEMVADIREEIGAARIDRGTSLPSTSGYSAGDYFYRTSTKELFEFNGSSFDPVESGTLKANSVVAGTINTSSASADILSATQAAITSLAAIEANLGEVTAGSINTLNSGVGLQVNVAAKPRAVYSYQNSTSVYGLFARNVASGGGTMEISSNGGFTGQFLNSNAGSGAFGAYVAVNAQNTTTGGGHGQAGISLAGGGYAFRSIDGGFYDLGGDGYNPFTGRHDGMISKTTGYDLGDIVVDAGIIIRSLSDSFTELEISSSPNQKGAVGVLAKVYSEWYIPASFVDSLASRAAQEGHVSTPDSPMAPMVTTHNVSDYEDDYDLININAVGEGAINVIGENGNISKGDLIVTSSTLGKGMKQSDDIVRSYTVAKVRENVTFSSPTEVKMVACIYLCG